MSVVKRKKGCSCTTGCDTLRCGCKSNGIKCDVNCECVETGCTNLAYCGCRTDCSTKKCSCQKSGINCISEKCKCNPQLCVNHHHPQVLDSNLTSSPTFSAMPNFTMHQEKNINFVQNNYNLNIYSAVQPFQLPSVNSDSSPLLLTSSQKVTITPVETQSESEIGKAFVQHFFQEFINNRVKLHPIFEENAELFMQGDQIIGSKDIIMKLLGMGNVQVTLIRQDFQAINDSVEVSVDGIMMDQQMNSVKFNQLFHLVNYNNAWFIRKMKFDWQLSQQ